LIQRNKKWLSFSPCRHTKSSENIICTISYHHHHYNSPPRNKVTSYNTQRNIFILFSWWLLSLMLFSCYEKTIHSFHSISFLVCIKFTFHLTASVIFFPKAIQTFLFIPPQLLYNLFWTLYYKQANKNNKRQLANYFLLSPRGVIITSLSCRFGWWIENVYKVYTKNEALKWVTHITSSQVTFTTCLRSELSSSLCSLVGSES